MKTLRRFHVFEIYAAKGRIKHYKCLDFLRIMRALFDAAYAGMRPSLKKSSFAFHPRLTGQGFVPDTSACGAANACDIGAGFHL